MGYDLVTWSPRIGSSGDDKYDVPGATRISGSLDTSVEFTKNVAGPSTYSATPAIDEINAGSYWNQVIALYNRRVEQLNALRGRQLAGVYNYFSPDVRVSASAILNLYSVINTLLHAEGFVGYAFPSADVVANKKVRGYLLAHARKALRISGVQTINLSLLGSIGFGFGSSGSRWHRQRIEFPYGVVLTSRVTSGQPVANYGGRGVFHSGGGFIPPSFSGFERTRAIMPLPIYGFVNSSEIASATLQFTANVGAVGGGIGELGLTSATQPNSYVAPVDADFNGPFVASVSFSTTGVKTLSLSPSQFVANTVRQIMQIEQHEYNGSPTPVGFSQVSPRDSSGDAIVVIINWGS